GAEWSLLIGMARTPRHCQEAAFTIANERLLDLTPDQVNLHGGAVTLGHTIGASGARVLMSLLSCLAAMDLKRGVSDVHQWRQCHGSGGGAQAGALVAAGGVGQGVKRQFTWELGPSSSTSPFPLTPFSPCG
ncbi:unnamed protein product, partial [Closterium sp. Naga37s-1]